MAVCVPSTGGSVGVFDASGVGEGASFDGPYTGVSTTDGSGVDAVWTDSVVGMIVGVEVGAGVVRVRAELLGGVSVG